MSSGPIPPLSYYLAGIGALFTIFNVILVIFRVRTDIQNGVKTNRHWIAACFLLTLPLYCILYSYALFNPENLTTNKPLYAAFITLSNSTALITTLLSVLKYFSIVVNPVKRALLQKATIIGNTIFVGGWIILGIVEMYRSPILPVVFSSVFQLLTILVFFENTIVGSALFTLKLRQQMKSFPTQNQSLKLLVTKINTMNFAGLILWSLGLFVMVALPGTYYLSVSLIILHNCITFVENFGDLWLKSDSKKGGSTATGLRNETKTNTMNNLNPANTSNMRLKPAAT